VVNELVAAGDGVLDPSVQILRDTEALEHIQQAAGGQLVGLTEIRS
jgi:hypothetical protein